MLSNLCAEITASGVNNKVFAAVLINVNLYKMVAAAERSERSLKSLGIP